MATLLALPGSNPSLAAELMLRRKRIAYRRIDLVPVVHRVVVRALGFPAATVPAVLVDGRRLQGTRTISRALDRLRPEPPLFPCDPRERAAVEGAEAWGEEVLQPAARRIAYGALRRASSVRSFLEGARLGVPVGLVVRTAPPVIALSASLNRASDTAVRADLEALPQLLDRVDELIAEQVIGGGEPSAADFQVFTSIRLVMAFDDLLPFIRDRPAGQVAVRVVPSFPGRIPPTFAPEWLAPLAQAA